MTILWRSLLAGNCGGMSLCLGHSWLHTSRNLHPLPDHLNNVLSCREAFVFLEERLIWLRKVHFLLAIRKVLQVLIKLKSFAVGTVKNLVLLKVILNGLLVGEVYDRLFELDEIMNTCETAWHPLQGLLNCTPNVLKITPSLAILIRRVRLAIKMAMLVDVLTA